MTTDIFTQTLISDGMALDPTDLSRLSARALAYLYDQVIASTLPRQQLGALALDTVWDPTTNPYALALSVIGARPRQGSANNKVQIAPGTLLQAIAAADGTEPKLIPYTFAGTEEVTIANGDATNPRVDIVQMALSYVNQTESRDFQDATTRAPSSQTLAVRRRVQCTLSVKQGTPAASPTYPTPDAGNVVIAGVVVGATWAGGSGLVYDDTAGAVVVLHDQRMPLRLRSHGIHPTSYMWPTGSGNWAESAQRGVYVTRTVAVGTEDLYAPLTSWGGEGRIVGCDGAVFCASTVSMRISRFDIPTSSPVDLNGSNIGQTNPVALSGSPGMSFQTLHTPAAGPTVQAAGNLMGPPIWSNGRRTPGLLSTGELVTGAASYPIIRVINPAVPSRYYRFTFYVAEGL